MSRVNVVTSFATTSVGFERLKVICLIGFLPHERVVSQEILISLKVCLYRNNLKNRNFDKEASQNFDLDRMTIVRAQGMSEGQNFEIEPTLAKTDSSSCFGIHPTGHFPDEISSTIDYSLLAKLCEQMALSRHRCLLETLACEIVEAVIQKFPCSYAWIRIEKPAAIRIAEYAFVEYEKTV